MEKRNAVFHVSGKAAAPLRNAAFWPQLEEGARPGSFLCMCVFATGMVVAERVSHAISGTTMRVGCEVVLVEASPLTEVTLLEEGGG